MGSAFDEGFARRLLRLREQLLPFLKQQDPLLRESPTGDEITPEPDSPRMYAAGDDIRAIDWNLFARLDRLYLKTMTREEAAPLLILLDASGSMAAPDPLKLERARQVTAALGDLFLALGHEILLVPWSRGLEGVYGPYRGESDRDPLMEQLLRVHGEGASDLRRSIRQLLALESLRSASPILISDFLFPRDYAEEVLLLARRPFPTRALQILGDGETGETLRGNLILSDPESGEETHLLGSYSLTRRFRETLRNHTEDVAKLFRRAGVAAHRAVAGSPFEDITRELLLDGEGRRAW